MSMLPFNARRDVRTRLEDCVRRHARPTDRLYDVGCGTKPFAAAFAGVVGAHIGIDVDDGFYGNDAVDIIGVADSLPVADATADAVISSQVIEHLRAPEVAMREAHRVLRPGGLLFISFPLVFPLHAAPHDFFRYTRDGFAAMCARHGFEIIEQYEMAGFWYMASVFLDRYLTPVNRSFLKRLHLVDLAALPLHWSFWLLHRAEGAVYALIGKNVARSRDAWTLNYVFVARRRP